MAVTNVFQFVDWMTMEGLRLLTNSLEVTEHFETRYSKDFKQEFAIGGSERVPLPQQMLIRHGLGYTPQAINRLFTTINFLPPFGVDFEWDDVQACLEMERGEEKVKKEYIEPAMLQMKQEIDSQAALFAYQNSNNIVGVNGTDPTSLKMFNQGRQILIERAGWNEGDKGVIIPPSVNTSLVSTSVGLFNPPKAISAQYQEGAIGRYAGADWHESMSLYDHTAGTWAGAVTVNSFSTSTTNGSNTLVVNCTSGDTFNVGDVIGIASVYPANPMTRRQTSGFQTQTVVVQQAVTASASTATLAVGPTLYGPGSQYQNVTALPLANAVCTLFPGTSSPNGTVGKQGLLLNKGAFAIVSGKMVTPQAVEMSSQNTDDDTGISLRFVRAWDPNQSKMTNRFDALIGFGALRPNNCSVRLLAAA